jgi:hypothetical protein
MGNKVSHCSGEDCCKRKEQSSSSASSRKEPTSVKMQIVKADKYDEVPDAVVVDEAVARQAAFKQAWSRDELYSPQWLFAMAKKQDLCDDADLKILMDNEFDAFLIRKYGGEKLRDLGVSVKGTRKLVQMVSSM